MKRNFLILGLILLFSGLVCQVEAQHNINQVRAQSVKYQRLMALIDAFYVDTVNLERLTEDAIVQVLADLDPHSVYITAEDVEAMNEPLEGGFYGIGIQFAVLRDTLVVQDVVAGGPSEKVGLRAGDRIVAVEGENIAGKKMTYVDVHRYLKGEKGTVVNITVLRGTDRLDFRIVRDKIPLYSVDAAYMLDGTTGYVKVSRFAATTIEEFEAALKKLKGQGMQDLILDLQGNGGGYLNVAIELADEFLDKDRLIVYTQGNRQRREEALSTARGQFQEGRLVILVDESSASASEIVSGAVQDWDRGVIVGRRTFGKGLVQKPIPLPDGSMIRLTVSRYYTPTGRCIQKPYESGKIEEYQHDLIDRYNRGELMSADSIHFPDSMRYNTLETKRVVYGGGGIMPDVFIPVDTARYTDYHRKLVAAGLVNRIAMNYLDQNRAQMVDTYPAFERYKQEFTIDEALMSELLDMAKTEKIEYNEEEYNRSKALIKLQIKALIARDLYDMGQYFQIINDDNPSYLRALQLINDKEAYQKLLGR